MMRHACLSAVGAASCHDAEIEMIVRFAHLFRIRVRVCQGLCQLSCIARRDRRLREEVPLDPRRFEVLGLEVLEARLAALQRPKDLSS